MLTKDKYRLRPKGMAGSSGPLGQAQGHGPATGLSAALSDDWPWSQVPDHWGPQLDPLSVADRARRVAELSRCTAVVLRQSNLPAMADHLETEAHWWDRYAESLEGGEVC